MPGQPKTRARRAMQAQAEAEAHSDGIDGTQTADVPAPDTSAKGDRPPRAARPRSGRRADPPASGVGTSSDRRPPGIRKIEDGLTQSFMLAGLGLSLWDPFDGQVVALNAEKLARSWADLAAQNATVRRYLEKALQGGAWGAALGSTAMIAIPILVRHGFAPMDLAVMAASNGVKIPDVYVDEGSAAATADGFPPVPDMDDGGDAPNPSASGSAPPRHPLDGSPVDAPANLPNEPVLFPKDASSGMNGSA